VLQPPDRLLSQPLHPVAALFETFVRGGRAYASAFP
jgi:hypothetical protein